MLVRRADKPHSDEEWRSFLRTHDFGQLIAPGSGRPLPVVVPTHFVYEGGDVALLHLARPNPVWRALEESPRGMLTVVGAYTYVTAELNTGPEDEPGYGVPTSYYAAVQVGGRAEVVDDPAELAELLNAQLRHFEPGRTGPPVDTSNPYAKLLPAIRGIRFHFEEVRAKFKFGGNRHPEHARAISEALRERGGDLDVEASLIQQRRLERPR
ncbi:MAG TPA: FMN-binding negative transcriptional regulator [Actinomycetota bacterium]|nr:FMN-binding negative transcriptional regulator [Actinomycetota bacterium]